MKKIMIIDHHINVQICYTEVIFINILIRIVIIDITGSPKRMRDSENIGLDWIRNIGN